MEESDCCLYEGMRIYRNGDIERNFKRLGWKKVRNHNNKGDGYNVLTVKKSSYYVTDWWLQLLIQNLI